MIVVGLDVGSTPVKAVLCEDGAVRWQEYQRHDTKQAWDDLYRDTTDTIGHLRDAIHAVGG